MRCAAECLRRIAAPSQWWSCWLGRRASQKAEGMAPLTHSLTGWLKGIFPSSTGLESEARHDLDQPPGLVAQRF